MCNRIDSTTTLLKKMFLHCMVSDKTLIDYAQNKHKMCNKCTLIDTEENFKVFQFDFDTEKLNYKFDLEIKPMGGIQKITDIVFIGFCD
jgi:hypothetical protein